MRIDRSDGGMKYRYLNTDEVHMPDAVVADSKLNGRLHGAYQWLSCHTASVLPGSALPSINVW
jgi:hypothetical protein